MLAPPGFLTFCNPILPCQARRQRIVNMDKCSFAISTPSRMTRRNISGTRRLRTINSTHARPLSMLDYVVAEMVQLQWLVRRRSQVLGAYFRPDEYLYISRLSVFTTSPFLSNLAQSPQPCTYLRKTTLSASSKLSIAPVSKHSGPTSEPTQPSLIRSTETHSAISPRSGGVVISQ
ncbi:hypothetical protein GQ43DRAFT_260509 [Delitschia confertaspora ATCC 74209]|uniref:Uncharacterized protein n=1 Tax=Delitschia confertaspora ATCC 74209 TaxID=1513339 RepID=A0A9P4JQH6_9PLEO|nr:hypothetical protein GQ43DRAFT_260509 [Delitschia confertaspora ATCC 74209]